MLVTGGISTPSIALNTLMSLTLSGAFDTSQLPRVASEPVTVTVARTILPGTEAQFLQWADEVLATLREYHGCLGAGILHPGPDGGEYQIVSRFVDGLHLRQWERSPQRAALMAEAHGFVTTERVQRTVGVDNWFELPARAEPKRSVGGRIVTDVLWVYPAAIVATLLIAPRIALLPTGWRVLVSTAVITVLMRLAVGPLRTRLRARRSL